MKTLLAFVIPAGGALAAFSALGEGIGLAAALAAGTALLWWQIAWRR
jgi:hypothetical protein